MVGKMGNRQLDTYLEELATSGLLETDSTCYLYLRKLAHHFANDGTLIGYENFIQRVEKNTHIKCKYTLPYQASLRQRIERSDAVLHMICVKGAAWYLEQCLHLDKNRVFS